MSDPQLDHDVTPDLAGAGSRDPLMLQRYHRERFPKQLFAVGFSSWKHAAVRDFFQGSTVRFLDDGFSIPEGSTVAIWGSKPVAGLSENVKIIRVEDGFLRSAGLGVLLNRAMSMSLDPIGIYYDARTPSALESILQSAELDAALIERARRLRETIVAADITKYNVAGPEWRRPTGASHVILVPGQVEDDASIRFGAPGVRTNADLLKAVRRERPGSYLVYKPHPDVVAGLRDRGNEAVSDADLCDEIITRGAIAQIISVVDEIHTMTSLSGFEGLLRNKPVVCHGQPFYAGWGMTTDVIPIGRRTRKRTLDELVAASLILYPTYVSPQTGAYITAEEAVAILVASRKPPSLFQSLAQLAWHGVLRLDRLLHKASSALRKS